MDLPQPTTSRSDTSREPRRALAVLLTSLAALVLTAGAKAQPTPARPSAEVATQALELYRGDLLAALRLTSPAALRLSRDVADARAALASARSGLSLVGTFQPGAELEQDLALGTATWDLDLELEVSGAYRYDREGVLEANIALERAEARLRARRRSDLEDALVALSRSRLSARDVADARLEAERAAAALARAVANAAAADEIESLDVAAELAAVALERELLVHREPGEALAELGLRELTPAEQSGVAVAHEGVAALGPAARLARPPAPALEFSTGSPPGTSGELRLLALELELAEHAVAKAPFTVARELELYGGYEERGLMAGARLAVDDGVPAAEATLGWELGDDSRALTFGFGATFGLSDSSSTDMRVAQRDVADARAALAAGQAAWPAEVRDQRSLAQLAYDEFALELKVLDLDVAALEELEADGVDDEDEASAHSAVRRARDASERAWQRYVRALGDYLDVLDVALRPD